MTHSRPRCRGDLWSPAKVTTGTMFRYMVHGAIFPVGAGPVAFCEAKRAIGPKGAAKDPPLPHHRVRIRRDMVRNIPPYRRATARVAPTNKIKPRLKPVTLAGGSRTRPYAMNGRFCPGRKAYTRPGKGGWIPLIPLLSLYTKRSIHRIFCQIIEYIILLRLSSN
jgi:hypothetical protein